MTLKLENLSVGDTIRYSVTAKVTDVRVGSLRATNDNDDDWYWTDADLPYLEVIKKAPRVFKVGDEVAGMDYERLPEGAVVQGEAEYPFLKTTKGWVSPSGNFHDDGGFSSTRKIVALPAE